jgi:solute carrier family 25 iron transporter 28/37
MHHPEEEEDYDYESLGENTTMLQNAFAGALAGIAEHCAMYPVDSIKVNHISNLYRSLIILL